MELLKERFSVDKMTGRKKNKSKKKETERQPSHYERWVAMCSDFVMQRINTMNATEVREFAIKQANRAVKSLRLTPDEHEQYASAIAASIDYMNARDAEYLDTMRYRRELEEAKRLALDGEAHS